jgi:hypothetical protein
MLLSPLHKREKALYVDGRLAGAGLNAWRAAVGLAALAPWDPASRKRFALKTRVPLPRVAAGALASC